ncbi:hypothetical protein K7I13_00630 [Brucepastera parasyntrophica]|uniref:hypothetical protein n=1 Tax=Brucepastera parasyntrophica TaxID=2880008 RepID=UPI00210A49B3|nr:hypothetical protein [Brucepastera parasyntrophica]ULQ59892.1 hypothetical protein K7I13_00630 [Brucepastera parasyntrophica]
MNPDRKHTDYRKRFFSKNTYTVRRAYFIAILLAVIAVVLIVVLILFILHHTRKSASHSLYVHTSGEEEEKKQARQATGDSARQPEKYAASSGRTGEYGLSQKQTVQDTSANRAESQAVLSAASANSQDHTKTISDYSVEKNKQIDGNFAYRSDIDVLQNANRDKQEFSFNAEKKDKQIHYSVEKNTFDDSISAFANRMESDKNERYSVLSGAASAAHHTNAVKKQTRAGASSSDHIDVKKDGRLMLNLFVQNQTTHIGKRNIHMIKAGRRLSIGGGSSDFLIFLVKFPANIAEIRYDGTSCTLAILKPEYFPYNQENIIHDCINLPFTVVSDKGYEVTFAITEHEDPVIKLNRLLTSIKY